MTFWAAGAVVLGSAIQAGSASHAAGVQADAASAGIAAQERTSEADRLQQKKMYDQTREDQLAQIAQTRLDYAPYRQAGYGALEKLQNETSPNGGLYQNYQRGKFEADPGYQFRVSEGENGIKRMASATGGMYSGATLKALARFNSGLASQEYGAFDTRENNKENQFNLNRDFHRNNLATIAGIGQTSTRDVAQAGATGTGAIGAAGSQAAGQIGQSYMNQGNQIAGLMGNAGESRASGYVGVGNAINRGIGDIYNNYQQQRYFNQPAHYGAPNPTGYSSDGYPVDAAGEMQFDI